MGLLLLFWVTCGILAAAIGSKKGEAGIGLLLGLLLGPFGVLAAILSSGNRKPCPFCREAVHKDAVVCPRCQREFPPVAAPATTSGVSPVAVGFLVIVGAVLVALLVL